MEAVSLVFSRASCSRTRAFAGFSVSLAMKPFASYDASARVTRPAALRVLRTTAMPSAAALASAVSTRSGMLPLPIPA